MGLTPCDNTCVLDEDGEKCISCNRTIEDIMNWGDMSREKRIERMKEISEPCNGCNCDKE